MKTKDFYRKLDCDEKYRLQQLGLMSQKRHLVLSEAIDYMCDELAHGTKKNGIIKGIKKKLEEKYVKEDFTFDWLMEVAIKDDLFMFERFLQWLNFATKKIESSRRCYLAVADEQLYCKVSLIITYDNGDAEDTYEAFIINFSDHRFSYKGRSIKTKLDYSLDLLVAKAALEADFPNITVSQVSLCSSNDVPDKRDFTFSTTGKGANILSCGFNTLYTKEGYLDLEQLNERVAEVLSMTISEANCYGCRYQPLCNTPSYRDSNVLVGTAEKKRAYKMPVFTTEQKEAINTVDGPVLICAGPGSGKTATLTGRVKNLIDSGIDAEHILVITFTNKAAGEIKTRISSCCSGMPTVCTLNALGYDIIRNNSKLFNVMPRVATLKDRLKLLKRVLDGMPKIKGVSYANLYGYVGLLQTTLRRFKAIDEDYEKFVTENPDIDVVGLKSAKAAYEGIIKVKGIISFDEQVSLANELFRAHPEVLKRYQNIYQYIMVDEYQDVDVEQKELIDLIAGDRKNLCVVGDDDQAIYGFRGGNNIYMINFTTRFPGAKKIILKDNFRSSVGIVNTASRVIDTFDSNRISKELVAYNKSEELPHIVKDVTYSDINVYVNYLVKNGYQYGDIAILAIKNRELDKIRENATFPCIIAKSYLKDDALFLVILDMLKLKYNGMNDDETLYHVISCLNKKVAKSLSCEGNIALFDRIKSMDSRIKEIEDVEYYISIMDTFDGSNSLLEIISKVAISIAIIEGMRVDEMIYKIAYVLFGIDEHIVLQILYEKIRDEEMDTFELFNYMQEVKLFEDDTRIEYGEHPDMVQLMTSHDSKGKEFKAVIVWRIEDYSEEAESVRLLYVALTRAKESLFVLQSQQKSVKSEKLIEELESMLPLENKREE